MTALLSPPIGPLLWYPDGSGSLPVPRPGARSGKRPGRPAVRRPAGEGVRSVRRPGGPAVKGSSGPGVKGSSGPRVKGSEGSGARANLTAHPATEMSSRLADWFNLVFFCLLLADGGN